MSLDVQKITPELVKVISDQCEVVKNRMASGEVACKDKRMREEFIFMCCCVLPALLEAYLSQKQALKTLDAANSKALIDYIDLLDKSRAEKAALEAEIAKLKEDK